MTTDGDVLKASEKFYAGLNRMITGDASSLSEIWSHSATVTTMHPIGGRQVGWEQVRGSWEQVAKLATGGQVKLVDQIVHVVGDVAYEIGIERGKATLAGQGVTFEDRVTNVYRRESGTWKIVHHHTDISAAMMEILKRLQAKK